MDDSVTIETMARIELTSGRMVSIERRDIENIYSGILEGGPAMVAKYRCRIAPQRLAPCTGAGYLDRGCYRVAAYG